MTNSPKKIFSFSNALTPVVQSLPLLVCLIILEETGKLSSFNFTIIYAIALITLFIINRSFAETLALQDRKSALYKHDNKDIKATQSLLSNIIDNLADPFLLLDSKQKILMANGSAKKIYGRDILKNNIDLYIRNQDVLKAITHTFETGKSDTIEFKSGIGPVVNHLMRLHIINAPAIKENASERRYLLLSIYDITEIKQAEKMRVSFVANASHELKTPLASILGFIETLQGPAKSDSKAQGRFLKIMHDEAKRMSRLIHDLLSLSRIERDEHIPPENKLDLTILINSVIETLEMLLAEKNMTIVTNLSEDFKKHKGDILGDYDQLIQVFQNLIENAIKYGSKDSEIQIDYALQKSPAPYKASNVTISITNEGPGIAAKHLPHLMERFYRVDTARSRALGGTGLGLAIVKHIIHRHKGQIFFESEVNKYTRVTIHLPLQYTVIKA